MLAALLAISSQAAPPLHTFARPYTPAVQQLLNDCQGTSALAEGIDSLRGYLAQRAAVQKQTVVVIYNPASCVLETNNDFLAFKQAVKDEHLRLRNSSPALLEAQPRSCAQTLAAAAALIDGICEGVSSPVHIKVLATEDATAMSGAFPDCAGQSACAWVEKGVPGATHQYHFSQFARSRADAAYRLSPVRIVAGTDPVGGHGYQPPPAAPPAARSPGSESAPRRRPGLFNIGPAVIPGLFGH